MEQLPIEILGAPWLLASVLVPFAAAILSPVLEKRIGIKGLTIMNVGALLFSLLITSGLTWSVFVNHRAYIDPVYFTHPFIGSWTMLLDPLSAPLVVSIALVTSFVGIYSLPYMEHRFEEMEKKEHEKPFSWGIYYMLYTMFAAAMIGTALATNLIEFYLFFELTLLPSFLLIAFYGYGDRVRIAIMFLIWTHVGALLLLFGCLATGFAAHTFDILNAKTLTFNVGLGERVITGVAASAVTLAMTIGLFVKMAVFGVHIWLPYAHAEAPTPVSALLSPNLIGIGAYALVRIPYTLFPSVFSGFSDFMLALALITMVYGGLMALSQDDFKRFLAYSSISQMGYLLLGISSLNGVGITGSMLHYASHAVGKALLFTVAGCLIVQLHGLRKISKMGGLAPKMPLTAVLALIGFMHITGIPPSLGFWSEVLIVFGVAQKAINMGSTALAAIVAALLVAIGLSTAYAFITMKRIFFGKTPEMLEHAKDAGWYLIGPMFAIAVAGVVLFFYPTPFIDPLIKAMQIIYNI